MTEQNTPSEASRQAYIEFLYTKAIEGDVEAGGELSMIALGGYQPARELVKKMDQLLAGRTFEGTPNLKMTSSPHSKLSAWRCTGFPFGLPRPAMQAFSS